MKFACLYFKLNMYWKQILFTSKNKVNHFPSPPSPPPPPQNRAMF